MPEEEKINKDSKEPDTLSQVTFASDLLNKQNEIRNMLDIRSNIIIGFNSALIVLIVTFFKDRDELFPLLVFVLVILVSSLLFAILALKPPHTATKKGQKNSLFYHHYIESRSLEDYRAEVMDVIYDKNKIFNAFIEETYNLTKYSNIPRKFYLYLSIRVLIYGTVLSILIFGSIYLFGIINK